MPVIMPNPRNVEIKDISEIDYFPNMYYDYSKIEITNRSASENNFLPNVFALKSIETAGTVGDDPMTAPVGGIINTSIPCLCTGISIDFNLNYCPDGNGIAISNCISANQGLTQFKSWNVLNGLAYVGFQHAFMFGLSGFFNAGSPEGSKYHFRWVFSNHSTVSNSNISSMIFYINADNNVRIQETGMTIWEMRNASLSVEPSHHFIPDRGNQIVELFSDRIMMNGIRPTNIVIGYNNSGTKSDVVINQDTWGVNASDILSCRLLNGNGVTLQPFNLPCGNSNEQKRNEVYIFGWRQIKNYEDYSYEIYPIKMKLNKMVIYWGKSKRPILSWTPIAHSDVGNPPKATGMPLLWDSINHLKTPLLIRDDSSKMGVYASSIIAKTKTTRLSDTFTFNESDVMENNDYYLRYNFKDWNVKNKINGDRIKTSRVNQYELTPTGFLHKSPISANYVNTHLLFDLEAINGKIMDGAGGEEATFLNENQALADVISESHIFMSGYKLGDSGSVQRMKPTHDNVSNTKTVECISANGLVGFTVNPKYLRVPQQLSGESMTIMGWFKFDHYGRISANVGNSIAIEKFNVYETGNNKYNPKEQWKDNRSDTENGRQSFREWANFPFCGCSETWNGSRFVAVNSRGTHGWYLDLNTNGGFSGLTPAEQNITLYDPRTVINFATLNLDGEGGEKFNLNGSSGALVLSSSTDIPSGFPTYNESYRKQMCQAFNKIKGNWTFFACSLDPGGMAGYYGRYPVNRGYRLGYIRNEQGTHFITNPSLSCLSSSFQYCSFPIFPASTLPRDTADGWFSWIKSYHYEHSNGFIRTFSDDGNRYEGWMFPNYLFKYIKIYDMAFTKERLDEIYENEIGMFY